MMDRVKLVLGSRIINSKGFNIKLVRQKTMCWTFDENLQNIIPPFIQCLNMITTGFIYTCPEIEIQFKKEFFSNGLNIPITYQQKIADIYNVIIDYYIEYPVDGGKELYYSYSLGGGNYAKNGIIPSRIALLKSNEWTYSHIYLLFFPNRSRKLDLVCKWIYCNTCGDWRGKKDWVEHLKKCRKCGKCGKQFFYGSAHELHCTSNHYNKDKRKPTDEAKMYELEDEEKKELSFENIHFADLETFVPPEERDYTTYAAGYTNSSENDNIVHIWTGKRSLDDFMWMLIKSCEGVLWFFNGSRFDNFFLFRWILKHGIIYNQHNLLISGNNILSLCFKTKKGWLHLKDLAKFMIGSLDSNCKAFGVPQELAKSEFDHLKIKTWDDVNYFHIKEYSEYLRLDVVALKTLYMIYAKQMFNLYHLDIGKFMTSSQLAYASWSAGMKKKELKFYKTSAENENIMREMYKGGRVFCGRKEWKSSFFKQVMDSLEDNIIAMKPFNTPKEGPSGIDALFIADLTIDGKKITQELYDKIDDYLVYSDVNSLYPAAQVNCKYPYGRCKRILLIDTLICSETYLPKMKELERDYLLEMIYLKGIQNIKDGKKQRNPDFVKYMKQKKAEMKEKWWKTGFCVDVECPDDLTVGFLTFKNDKGEAIQDLLPKTKIWYTGPELWEATKLGYTITKIYEIVEWEHSDEIFNEFVIKTYKIKKEAVEEAKRAAAKSMLNSLTGKYGQKNIIKQIVVFGVNDVLKRDLMKVTEIMDDGKVLSFYGFEEKNHPYAPFPIEESAFILAHARIYMSKFLRRMKIERAYDGNFDETLYYSDTDSMIIHRKSWDRLNEKYKGDKELGQLKLEIDGKIIAIQVFANKSYAVTYVCAKTLKLMSIVKCKGIPHKGGDNPKNNFAYNTTDFYSLTVQDEEKAILQSGFMTLRRDTPKMRSLYVPQSNNIKFRAYIFREASTWIKNEKKKNPIEVKGKILHICYKIPPLLLHHVLKREWTLECIYGGMIRKLAPGSLNEIFIAPETKSRMFCLTDWWAKGTRQFSNHPSELAKRYPTAFPPGHYMLNELQ